MRHASIALILLATACAAPPPPRPDVRITLAASEAGAFDVPEVGGEHETRRYGIQAEEIDDAHAIRKIVAPASWDGDSRVALYVEKDELVVRHVPAVLEKVERLIETLKANRKAIVRAQVRYVSMPIADLVAVKFLPALREGLGGVLDRKTVRDLAALVPHTRIALSSPPRMTLHHGQSGVVNIGSQSAYIKAVQAGEDGFVPQVDVVTSGVELRLQVVMNGASSDRFLLEAGAVVQDLASLTTLQLWDHAVQLPAIVVSRAGGRFVLGPDQAAVLFVPQVRSRNGILGSLGGTPPESARVTLVVIELDRPE